MTRSATVLILSAALLLFTGGTVMAQSSDRITAAIIVKELKTMGYQSTVDTDSSGDPRINMMIDGYNWSIYFYDCAPGARDDRQCVSYQFYSGYVTAKPVPLETLNTWNAEERYARAYHYTTSDKRPSARIEIDVRTAGTGADPAQTFRIHFNIMKDRAIRFRKAIGVT